MYGLAAQCRERAVPVMWWWRHSLRRGHWWKTCSVHWTTHNTHCFYPLGDTLRWVCVCEHTELSVTLLLVSLSPGTLCCSRCCCSGLWSGCGWVHLFSVTETSQPLPLSHHSPPLTACGEGPGDHCWARNRSGCRWTATAFMHTKCTVHVCIMWWVSCGG